MIEQQLSAVVRNTASLRYLAALARYRMQLAEREARQFKCALGHHEAALSTANKAQGALVLGLLTCGISHRRALRILRQLEV